MDMHMTTLLPKTVLIALLIAIPSFARAAEPVRQKWGGTPSRPPSYPRAESKPVDEALRDAARSELIKEASAQDAFMRSHVIEAWKQIGGNEAVVAAVAGLSDPAPVVRFSACMALGELKEKSALPQVIKRLDDKDRNVQVAARYALHRMGDKRHSHDLEKFAMDWNAGVRGNTMMVLGLLGEPSALKILKHKTGDSSPAVVVQVAEARWRLGDLDGLADLISGSISPHPDEEITSYLAMAGPRDQRVIEHVRGGLTNYYAEVRLAAARAMGMLGSDEGYGIAMEGAKSADPRQRSLAALAFGAIGRTDSQQHLAELLKDKDDEVRVSAATAILQLH
jgi:HEAT repeat protein